MQLFFLLSFAISQFFFFEKKHIEVKVFHRKKYINFFEALWKKAILAIN